MRSVTRASLTRCAQDVIVPHHFTFHELITTRARGRNGGPLFIFDNMIDDDREREDSHTAKMCERRWYDQNRHIFPASRWTIYESK